MTEDVECVHVYGPFPRPKEREPTPLAQLAYFVPPRAGFDEDSRVVWTSHEVESSPTQRLRLARLLDVSRELLRRLGA